MPNAPSPASINELGSGTVEMVKLPSSEKGPFVPAPNTIVEKVPLSCTEP